MALEISGLKAGVLTYLDERLRQARGTAAEWLIARHYKRMKPVTERGKEGGE
jgi:hypothetical protein